MATKSGLFPCKREQPTAWRSGELRNCYFSAKKMFLAKESVDVTTIFAILPIENQRS